MWTPKRSGTTTSARRLTVVHNQRHTLGVADPATRLATPATVSFLRLPTRAAKTSSMKTDSTPQRGCTQPAICAPARATSAHKSEDEGRYVLGVLAYVGLPLHPAPAGLAHATRRIRISEERADGST